MFSDSDIKQITEKGIKPEDVIKQIECFKTGFPPLELVKPAIRNDGIIIINESQINKYISQYDTITDGKRIVKFVPASGAATRMFKHLISFRNKNLNNVDQFKEIQKDQEFDSVFTFFKNLTSFAFYDDLSKLMEGNQIYKNDISDYNRVLDLLLSDKGLDHSSLPKALLKFHKYNEGSRTCIEEHLVEATDYALSSDKIARIHFTISPEHIGRFESFIKKVIHHYETEFNVHYEITHSIQDPSTDTIAVDLENEPFREDDGRLHFRPGGHGALIKNLGEIDADFIFIKNIDNVVPDRLKPESNLYKKVMLSYLLDIQSQAFNYLRLLYNKAIDDKLIDGIFQFIISKLNILIPGNIKHSSLPDLFIKLLNRPFRVCSMVKNEGEPGGGPFWVKGNDGNISLQIVEYAQADSNNVEQMNIMKSATHFNPVDIVCSIMDFQGNKFNLAEFIDTNTGFITHKSKNGRDLKALELPGLWNGAMSKWNTVFIEVPIITFNPVKTINDLLRHEHVQ